MAFRAHCCCVGDGRFGLSRRMPPRLLCASPTELPSEVIQTTRIFGAGTEFDSARGVERHGVAYCRGTYCLFFCQLRARHRPGRLAIQRRLVAPKRSALHRGNCSRTSGRTGARGSEYAPPFRKIRRSTYVSPCIAKSGAWFVPGITRLRPQRSGGGERGCRRRGSDNDAGMK